jgi:hypothetical protein
VKTLLVSFLIILSSSETILFAQEQLTPFVLSPLIGEKLDRVEESYFNLFSGVPSFNEATFYLDADSSLFINIQFYEKDLLKDTLIVSKLSLPNLRDRINDVILKDIKAGRVEELEFITENNEKHKGTVYSFDGKQIRLIEPGFSNLVNNYSDQNYLPQFNYSDINTVSRSESSTAVTIMISLIGMLAGGLIGEALTSEPRQPETFPEIFVEPIEDEYKSMANTLIGIGVGGLIGFFVGRAIQVPVEYDCLDSETKRIINDNSLLPSGL